MNAQGGVWEIVIRDPEGGPSARVTVEDGELTVDPPAAEESRFVAAAVTELRRSLIRPRRRPSCIAEPMQSAEPAPWERV